MSKKIREHQKKKWFLISVLFIFAGIIWAFSVSRTISIYKQNQDMLKVLNISDGDDNSVRQLSKALKKFDDEFQIDGDRIIDYRGDFLQKLGKLSTDNDIQIRGIGISGKDDSKSYKNEILEIKLKGNFGDVLKVIQGLEENLYYGTVLSMKFEKRMKRRMKAEYLDVMINVQIVLIHDII